MMTRAPGSLTVRVTLRALTIAIRGLGPVRRPLALLVGGWWYRSRPRAARERVAANHRRMQPQLGRRAAHRLARQSFGEYLGMMADTMWAEPLDAAGVRRYVRLIDEPNLTAPGEGGVLAVSHFGNWDMAASVAMSLGRELSTVMAPIGSTLLTEMVVLSRARKGLELFTPRQAARGLVRALRRGRLVALMVDVPEAGPTVEVRFCGGPVRFSAVPARLAAAAGRPIIPVACWRSGAGWTLQFFPQIRTDSASEQEVTARVAAVLEAPIRRHPEQWYPFHEVYTDGAGAGAG